MHNLLIAFCIVGQNNANEYESFLCTAQQLKKKIISCDSSQEIPYLEYHFLLILNKDKITLADCRERKPLFIDANFVSGSVAHRRQYGGGKGQMLAKAIGLKHKNFYPHVLDATAGLGKDGFVLASLGCRVSMQERSPIVFSLLHNGLSQAKAFAEVSDMDLYQILERIDLLETDSLNVPEAEKVNPCVPLPASHDVVYLDPMFPESKKKAQVKKDMFAFHEIVGADLDAGDLLAMALRKAKYRVVVKRQAKSAHLNGQQPSFQLMGKSSRFDIYTLQKIP